MKSNPAIVQQSIRNHFRKPGSGDASAISGIYSYRVNKSTQWVSTRKKPRDTASLSKAKSMEVLLSIMLLYFRKTLFSQHATKAEWKKTMHHVVTFLGRNTPWCWSDESHQLQLCPKCIDGMKLQLANETIKINIIVARVQSRRNRLLKQRDSWQLSEHRDNEPRDVATSRTIQRIAAVHSDMHHQMKPELHWHQ